MFDEGQAFDNELVNDLAGWLDAIHEPHPLTCVEGHGFDVAQSFAMRREAHEPADIDPFAADRR